MKKRAVFLAAALAICAAAECHAAGNWYINGGLTLGDYYGDAYISESGTVYIPARKVYEELGGSIEWNEETREVTAQLHNSTLKLIPDSFDFFYNGRKYSLASPIVLRSGTTYIPAEVITSTDTGDVYVDSGCIHVTVHPKISEDIDKSVLVKYGIVSEEDLNKGGYITYDEAIDALFNITGEDIGKISLKDWYEGTELAPLDGLPDDTKKKILGLFSELWLFDTESLIAVDIEKYLTNYDALIYLTRFIGNTYGCTDSPEEFWFTEARETYERAYDKGLIKELNTEAMYEPITRDEFYDLLLKALYADRIRGGEGGRYMARYIDMLEWRESSEASKETEQPKETPAPKRIDVGVVLHDDMSVSWSADHYGAYLNIYEVSESGETAYRAGRWDQDHQITTMEMLEYLVLPKLPDTKYLRCIYRINDECLYFDIDISRFRVVEAGNAIRPGAYTKKKDGTYPADVTLYNGKSFERSGYYMIISHENVYRSPKYDDIKYLTFRVKDNDEVEVNLHSSLNGMYFDDMHMREAKIDGNAKDGFTVYVTPESEEVFTVNEIE